MLEYVRTRSLTATGNLHNMQTSYTTCALKVLGRPTYGCDGQVSTNVLIIDNEACSRFYFFYVFNFSEFEVSVVEELFV